MNICVEKNYLVVYGPVPLRERAIVTMTGTTIHYIVYSIHMQLTIIYRIDFVAFGETKKNSLRNIVFDND